MRSIFRAFGLALGSWLLCTCQGPAVPPPSTLPQALPWGQVQLTDAFWAPRLAVNYAQTLPYLWDTYAVHRQHFARSAGLSPGGYEGHRAGFADSEVYKLIEAHAYHRALGDPWPARLDTLIQWIAAAQTTNGHLQTRDALVDDGSRYAPDQPGDINRGGLHRLYNLGHLFEAASATHATHSAPALLPIAQRSADPLAAVYGRWGLRGIVPGHPEVEMGLLRLYQATGESRYLRLARYFLNERGQGGRADEALDAQYSQQHLPLRDQRQVQGHSVRALYLYRAMSWLGQLDQDQPLMAAADTLWADLLQHHLHLHGGSGIYAERPAPGRHFVGWEGFGPPDDLPPDGYAETCAGVALILWAADLSRYHRDAHYVDVLECTLYNLIAGAVAADGRAFCYENNLCAPTATRRGDRRDPAPMSCCPFNLARLLPQVPGWLYSRSDSALWVNLYASNHLTLPIAGDTLRLVVETDYPWQGEVSLRVLQAPTEALTLHLRLPGWATGQPWPSDLYPSQALTPDRTRWSLTLDGEAIAPPLIRGYLSLKRRWQAGERLHLHLPMPIRAVRAQPRVQALAGQAALMRGPLLYACEGLDQPQAWDSLALLPGKQWAATWQADTLGGLVWLNAYDSALVLRALPYHLRARRRPTPMRVWLPAP
jgi:hypothetical protein